MTVKRYDAREVRITIGGVELEGFGDGDFLTIDDGPPS